MVQSFFQPYGQSSRDDASGRHSRRGDLEGQAPMRAGAHYPDNQELWNFDDPAVPERVTVRTLDAADVDPRPMSRKASSRFKPSPQRARSAAQKRHFDVPMNIQYTTKPQRHGNQVPQHYGRKEEDSTIFGDMKSANTILDEASNLETPPRIRNANTRQYRQQQQAPIEYNDEDDSTMLGGLQFVSESGVVKPLDPIAESSHRSQQNESMYSYSVASSSQRSTSPTPPFENLPLDEYNVTLAMDDYSKTSSPSRFGNVRHLLPSQRRARNFDVLQKRRARCLKGFGILTLILAISFGVVMYMEFIDGEQNVTFTAAGSGTDPSQAGKSEDGPKPGVPNRPPKEVEKMKASEAYGVLGPQVENPALLLDPETPQGKAFDQIFQETTAPGRKLAGLWNREEGRDLQTEYKDYRITQRFALLVLYFSTSGETSWVENLGWDVFEPNECEWHGVECFNRNRITTSVLLCKL